VILGRKLVPGPHRQGFIGASPRSSYPYCSLALVSNSSHSSLPVFRHLRTLLLFGSQLSRVLPPGCALFRKKPGVHPYVVIPSFFLLGRRARPPQLQRRRAISFISPTCEYKLRMSFVSPTYAKTGECTPTQKCRRADIFDFSPYFSYFLPRAYAKGLAQSAVRRVAGHWFCYPMERPAFLRHRSQRSANSYRKVPHP